MSVNLTEAIQETFEWLIYRVDEPTAFGGRFKLGDSPATLSIVGSVRTSSAYLEPAPSQIEAELARVNYDGGEIWLIPNEKIVRYAAERRPAFSLSALDVDSDL